MVALAVAGCSGDNGASGAPAACAKAAPSAAAPATRVAANAADGFSVTLPEGWKDVVLDNDGLQKVFNDAGPDDLDKAVLDQVKTLTQRGGKLFAYDECERTTTLNVLKLPAEPGLTTDKVAESLPAQLAQLGLKDVKVEVAPVAAGPAAKASGTQTVKGAKDQDVELLQLQYYVVAGSTTFVAILSTDDPGRDRATLEAIGASFQLTPAQ